MNYNNPDYIEFANVHFCNATDTEILKGMSFGVEAGTATAIVGQDGGGRTAIFNLLLRIYSPSSGFIRIDSENIEDFSDESIQKMIGVVRQDPLLYGMSIKKNILLNAPDVSDEEMIQYCRIACLHDDIIKTEHGYHTLLGKDGLELSNGQRQRLAIAQVLLTKAPILLIEEATASWYQDEPSYMEQILKNIGPSRTVLIIAHRLSTVINTDKVLYCSEGEMSGTGEYSHLFCTNNDFRNFCKSEFSNIESSDCCEELASTMANMLI